MAQRGAKWPVNENVAAAAKGHFIVCGLGRFGTSVVERLREGGHAVVVITSPNTRADRTEHACALGTRVIEGDFRFHGVLEQAGLPFARGLLLVSSNNAANLETALDVKRLAPRVRVVLRLDQDKLAERLRRDFGIDAVLSPAVLAASRFAEAALAVPPPRPRSPVPAGPASAGLPHRFAVRRRIGLWGRFFDLPEPTRVLLALLFLFIGAVTLFQHVLHLPLADAVYFTSTIVTTVGFGDYNLKDEGAAVKLFGSLLMFAGVVLIAVLSSFLTNYFLSGTAARRRVERAAARLRGHVILCGLGSVGCEVAERLLARGVPVVVVDETPGDVHWHNLSHQKNLPLLVGDAARPDVLVRAGLDHARALIAATGEDAVNLEIGLVAQTLAEECRSPDRPLRLVLRCFDPDLANRVHAVSDVYALLSSAEIAAPLFVAAATERFLAADEHG